MKTFIIILFYSFFVNAENCAEYNEKQLRPIVISGTLSNKHISLNGEYILTIIKNDNSTCEVKLLSSTSSKQLYSYIQINDKIEKDKDSLLIRIAHFFSGGVEVKKFLIECN